MPTITQFTEPPTQEAPLNAHAVGHIAMDAVHAAINEESVCDQITGQVMHRFAHSLIQQASRFQRLSKQNILVEPKPLDEEGNCDALILVAQDVRSENSFTLLVTHTLGQDKRITLFRPQGHLHSSTQYVTLLPVHMSELLRQLKAPIFDSVWESVSPLMASCVFVKNFFGAAAAPNETPEAQQPASVPGDHLEMPERPAAHPDNRAPAQPSAPSQLPKIDPAFARKKQA